MVRNPSKHNYDSLITFGAQNVPTKTFLFNVFFTWAMVSFKVYLTHVRDQDGKWG